MNEWSAEEEQRRRRRKRIVRGLLVGGAAVGIPALINASIAQRARRATVTAWGKRQRYAWRRGDVSFQRLGSGAPLVLLHSFGLGHDSLEWRAAAERLAEHHQVFVPDLLGWGASDKPTISYDGEIYLELLGDFLDDIVRRRAVLVASGLSAAYAVQLAFDRPEAVQALALVCPLGIDAASDEPDLKDAVIHRLLRLPVFGRSAINVLASRRGITHHFEREVFADPERVDPAWIDHAWRRSHEAGAGSSLAAHLAGYLNHPVAPVLRRLLVPVWLGWGREAADPSIESADVWLQAIAEAELEIFERAGIWPHAERPREFVLRLSDFLGRLEPEVAPGKRARRGSE